MLRRIASALVVRRTAWAAVAIVAAGCGAARRDVHESLEPKPAHIATGSASWYGAEFAGRSTASGEVFDPLKLTAAHRTLPLGSVVRVTNLTNGRTVLVRINDRGPFAPDRILDCSEAAARSLGFRRHGVAQVAIDWPDTPRAAQASDGEYWLQLGAFDNVKNARRLRARVAPVDDSVAVHRHPDFVRVHAGPFEKRRQAEKALTRLQEAGFQGSIVVLDARTVTTLP